MTYAVKVGDHVTWHTSQGRTKGYVFRRRPSPMSVRGHYVTASKGLPEDSVKSDTSDATTAHESETQVDAMLLLQRQTVLVGAWEAAVNRLYCTGVSVSYRHGYEADPDPTHCAAAERSEHASRLRSRR